jgi:hypothetical protein
MGDTTADILQSAHVNNLMALKGLELQSTLELGSIMYESSWTAEI